MHLEASNKMGTPTTAKEVFAQLRESFINLDCTERRKVWNVLTALRGPDRVDKDLKTASTAVVRGVAFGQHASACIQEFALVEFADTDYFAELRNEASKSCDGSVDYHFLSHICRAFEALGLSFYGFNENIEL